MHEKLPGIHARRSDRVEYIEMIVSSQLYGFSPEIKVRCSDSTQAPVLAEALATSRRRGIDQVIECEGHHWFIHSYPYNSTSTMLVNSATQGADAALCDECLY